MFRISDYGLVKQIRLGTTTRQEDTHTVSGHPFEDQAKSRKYQEGIRGEKSSKDMAKSRNLVSTIGALASLKMGDGTRCPEG